MRGFFFAANACSSTRGRGVKQGFILNLNHEKPIFQAAVGLHCGTDFFLMFPGPSLSPQGLRPP